MLPKLDAIHIDYIPKTLMSNSRSLDIHSLLRNEESRSYFKSIKSGINTLSESGGKRLPGSNAQNLYIRPAELAALMGDLIKIINQDKEPKTDELLDRYLTNRFKSEIEKEHMGRFNRDILIYAKDVLCEELNQLNRPQNETESIAMDEKLKKKHNEFKKKCYDTMICLTRSNILGIDSSVLSSFQNETQRQEAFQSLPLPIQHRLNILEVEMNNIREAEILIERARTNLTISDLRRQTIEKQKLLEQIHEQMLTRTANLQQEKLINKSLNRAEH